MNTITMDSFLDIKEYLISKVTNINNYCGKEPQSYCTLFGDRECKKENCCLQDLGWKHKINGENLKS